MAISPLKDWAKALDSYVCGAREEVVPEGWHSKVEIAEHWGKSDVYVNRILARMIRSGVAERRMFTVRLQRGVGYCRAIPHYKLKKGKS